MSTEPAVVFVVLQLETYDDYKRGGTTTTIRGVYNNSNDAYRKMFRIISGAISELDSECATNDDDFRKWYDEHKKELGFDSSAKSKKAKKEEPDEHELLYEVRDRVEEYCAKQWPADWQQRMNYFSDFYEAVRQKPEFLDASGTDVQVIQCDVQGKKEEKPEAK